MVKSKTSAAKGPSPKSASPPRKSGKANFSPLRGGTQGSSSHQVKYSKTTIEGLFVAFFRKPDGVGPAFCKPNLRNLEECESKKEEACVLFTTERRDANDGGMYKKMVTTSSTGKEYTHDIAIISIEGTLLDIRTASNKLVKIMNKLSEELHDLYLYGAPKFVNKGEETSKDGIPPVSDFLLGEDCLSLLKRLFSGCDTKDEFMDNEHRDSILEAVFGDMDVGMSVVEDINEEDWETF